MSLPIIYVQGNQQTHGVASNDNAVESQEEKDPSDTTDSHLEDSVTWSAFVISWMNDCNLSKHAADKSLWVVWGAAGRYRFHRVEFRNMIMIFISVGNQEASEYHSPSQKGKFTTHADLWHLKGRSYKTGDSPQQLIVSIPSPLGTHRMQVLQKVLTMATIRYDMCCLWRCNKRLFANEYCSHDSCTSSWLFHCMFYNL